MASATCDLVVKYEVLKAQNVLEEKARNEWFKKWGFYLDFDKLTVEEAEKQGLSETEYKRRTVRRKGKGTMEADIWKIEPSKYVPNTSTGKVGWRAYKENSLEKFGPLHINPKLTLPYEPPYSSIFLG